MDYVRLPFELLAVVGGSTMISLLSPWRVTARVIPLLMFVIGMIVIALPTLPVLALAMMLPVALIQKYFGIDLHGHEPLDAGRAVQMARNMTQAAHDRIRKPEPVELREFATRAYPSPDDQDAEAEDDPGDNDDLDEPDLSPAERALARIKENARDPRLPAGSAGRLGQAALRSQPGRVESFVPAL